MKNKLTNGQQKQYNIINKFKGDKTMNNLINSKLNNWWNVWEIKNHPYKFVML